MQELGQKLIVKDLNIFLKDLEPAINDQGMILNGREDKHLHLKPREAIALCLLAAVANSFGDQKLTIAEDHEERDGILVNSQNMIVFKTEHVIVSDFTSGTVAQGAIKEIERKIKRGKDYCRGRSLIIFLDKVDADIDLIAIRNYLQDKDDFASYWLIGRNSISPIVYFVTTLKATHDPLQTYFVEIDESFTDWKVAIF
jgi:hypothetical protein